ncbi:MAG: hypothetical protein K6T63_03295 [Alicyclobacillus herbarius]|uniref:hypothetical protein n=1 Tax=Alicyclobacillus herbarius TaxID=122960 RepID=UPI00235757E3|nr:hypothetical protein [Alicyclobacillus herbarius]MCL6631633.1 hypothetical protein [Alicyclobacillus herbarius]
MTLIEVMLAVACLGWAAVAASSAERSALFGMEQSQELRASTEAADAVAETISSGNATVPSELRVNGYMCTVEVHREDGFPAWNRIQVHCGNVDQTIWVRTPPSDA